MLSQLSVKLSIFHAEIYVINVTEKKISPFFLYYIVQSPELIKHH